MSSIFLIVLFWVVYSLVKRGGGAGKLGAAKPAGTRAVRPATAGEDSADDEAEEEVFAPITVADFPQESLAAALAETYTPAAPTVQYTPHDHTDMYTGSMGDVFDEGFDPHDHGLSPVDVPSMHSDAEMNASLLQAEDGSASSSSLLPAWSGSELVRAFVLQEVLKRPSQR